MANKTIADLVAAGALDGTELLEFEQAGGSVKGTVGDLLSDAAPAGLGEAAVGTAVVSARGDHVHPATVAPNVQTADYTLAASDAGKAVEMDVADANTLTVPDEATVALPIGTVVEVCQVGAGQTTIAAASGVTIHTTETLILTGQWSAVTLRKRAADEWVLAGDVEAAA